MTDVGVKKDSPKQKNIIDCKIKWFVNADRTNFFEKGNHDPTMKVFYSIIKKHRT